MPATSLNAPAFFCCARQLRAQDLPKLSALFPPACITRIMKIKKPTSKSQRRSRQREIHPIRARHFAFTLISTPRSRSSYLARSGAGFLEHRGAGTSLGIPIAPFAFAHRSCSARGTA